ncbi:MAG TPA: hypothetical protein VGV37_11805 [Aliidongia sp.]|uniref:hypothetical protein n=1 Tax=Aliidongia sp. TaxID=1914230 RepID=UPI002DDD9DD6|nr:hypothetical protein [Aliidongia sp.]HEV2675217.1 hypothetical protein [Aliidongia sp.]
MFEQELISAIEHYREMQEVDDLQTRLIMNRQSSRDPLIQSIIGLNAAGEPGFSMAALAGQSEKIILERLGTYLIRERVEAGLLAYVAADRDALMRLAQAAAQPSEWLTVARRRIDRFSVEHPVGHRPHS